MLYVYMSGADPIINFDLLIKKKSKAKQNKNSFPFPGTCIAYGLPGSGKTNWICQFILSPRFHLFFDRLFIYASDLYDEKYQFIKEKFEDVEAKLSKKTKQTVKLLYMASDLTQVIPVDDLDRTKQNLVIFDDMIERARGKEHEIVTSYFTRSRRMNCFVFYATQSYFEIPRVQRTSCNYLVLFRINNLFDLKAVHRDVMASTPIDEFIKMYYEVLDNNPFGYVIIDLKTSDPKNKIRSTIAPKK
jgi:hypothetical protein